MDQNSLKKSFKNAWSKETCYPRQKDEWIKSNPALGQCAVTALVINDLYGGKILFSEDYNHFWNILPSGQEIDLTKEQFGEHVNFVDAQIIDRKNILDTKNAQRARTSDRYELLRSKVLPLLLVKS